MPSISGSMAKCGRCWQPTGQTSRSGSERHRRDFGDLGLRRWRSRRCPGGIRGHQVGWHMPRGGLSVRPTVAAAPPDSLAPGVRAPARRRRGGRVRSCLARRSADGARTSGPHSMCRTLCAMSLAAWSAAALAPRRPGTTCWWVSSLCSRHRESGAAGAAAARSLDRVDASAAAGTTDISVHLLRQAGRGLFGRAVHELICAISGDTNLQALRAAVQRVVETGATSGADTCMGLLAFAPSFFRLTMKGPRHDHPFAQSTRTFTRIRSR